LPPTNLSRALFGGFASRSLPNSHHGGRVSIDKPFYVFNQVVLKASAAKFAVRVYLHADGLLPLQRIENGLILNSTEFAQLQPTLAKSFSPP
jgi:hypothetical protein